MPLIWERDEAEERLYQHSIANPDKRFVVRETSQEITYYLDGVKCGVNKKLNITKGPKSKPFVMTGYGSAVEDWNAAKQKSFDFMHPLCREQLFVNRHNPDLSFADRQLSLGL